MTGAFLAVFFIELQEEKSMYDVIVIGAGVSGSATARELSRYDLKVGVLGKRRGCMLWNIQGEQRDRSCRI